METINENNEVVVDEKKEGIVDKAKAAVNKPFGFVKHNAKKIAIVVAGTIAAGVGVAALAGAKKRETIELEDGSFTVDDFTSSELAAMDSSSAEEPEIEA